MNDETKIFLKIFIRKRVIIMNYLEAIILQCIQHLNGERTPNSIFHLLKGKKSIQTIQDGKLFGLSHWFHSFPQLSKSDFQNIFNQLLHQNLIRKQYQGFSVTESGLIQLNQSHPNDLPPKFLNGWKFHTIDRIFWKRLNLLIQVLPYWVKGNSQFLPIQRDPEIQTWVKSFLKNNRQNKEALLEQMLDEMTRMFESMETDINPMLLIVRLSGYKKTGLTEEQAAQHFQMDLFYYITHFQAILHYLLNTIWVNKDIFPLFQQLTKDLVRMIPLTKTAETSYQLLKEGYSLREIALKRNLKIQTIEDHIVEIALMDNSFNIDPFVEEDLQKQIRQAIEQTKSKKLKEIKEQLKEDASYFSIRLVLAKLGESE